MASDAAKCIKWAVKSMGPCVIRHSSQRYFFVKGVKKSQVSVFSLVFTKPFFLSVSLG